MGLQVSADIFPKKLPMLGNHKKFNKLAHILHGGSCFYVKKCCKSYKELSKWFFFNLAGIQSAIFFFHSDWHRILASHGKWYNTAVETTLLLTFPTVHGYTMVSKISSRIILSLRTTYTGKTARDKVLYRWIKGEKLYLRMAMHFSEQETVSVICIYCYMLERE